MIRTALLGAFLAAMSFAGSLGCSSSGAGASGGTLSAAEAERLVFLREEEKLARDVYRAQAALGQPFVNIATSEQRHMDSVLVLLDAYGIDDPAAGQAEGAFTNAALQALHDDLVTQAAASPAAALAVGAEIEEIDLGDLEDAEAASAHADVIATYDQLARGSRNHLRAFYGALSAAGVAYAPRHLDEATFTAIVSSPREQGGP